MMKDVITQLCIFDVVTYGVREKLTDNEHSFLSWQIINHLCFIIENDSLRKGGYSGKSAEEVRALQERARRAHKYVKHAIPRLKTAEGFFTEVLASEIIELLEMTKEVGIHPALEHELMNALLSEPSSYDSRLENERERRTYWSNVLGINFSENEDITVQLSEYFSILDLFVALAPELIGDIGDLTEGVEDEYYSSVIDAFLYIDVALLWKFADKSKEILNGKEMAKAFLQLVAYRNELVLNDSEASVLSEFLEGVTLDEVNDLTLKKRLDLQRFFGVFTQTLMESRVSKIEEDPYERLFGKDKERGVLPNEEKYKQLLPEWWRWGIEKVKQLARNGNFPISESLESDLKNSAVDRLLNGVKIYETFFVSAFRKQVTSPTAIRWTMREITVMAIVMEFERLKCGGNPPAKNTKNKFVEDLLQTSKELIAES